MLFVHSYQFHEPIRRFNSPQQTQLAHRPALSCLSPSFASPRISDRISESSAYTHTSCFLYDEVAILAIHRQHTGATRSPSIAMLSDVHALSLAPLRSAASDAATSPASLHPRTRAIVIMSLVECRSSFTASHHRRPTPNARFVL
jgi:hypothetical protein